MNTQRPAAPDLAIDDDVLDQAIAWMVKLQAGNTPAHVETACRRWRAESSEHERAWQALCASHLAISNDFAHLSANPEIATKTLNDTLRARKRRMGRRHVLKALALGATALAGGALIWRPPASLTRMAGTMLADHATRTGERRRMLLDDGTELLLNTSTAIDVRFTPTQRLLVLWRGEIYATTGPDAASPSGRRPFFITTPHARFEALGTRYGVRHDTGRSLLRVDEAAVSIHTENGPPVIAEAGQRYIVDAEGIRIDTDTSIDTGSWTSGALVAHRAPLRRFLEELGRYHDGRLDCAPQIADLPVTGVFQLDAIDRALAALPHSLPVSIRRHDNGSVTVEPG